MTRNRWNCDSDSCTQAVDVQQHDSDEEQQLEQVLSLNQSQLDDATDSLNQSVCTGTSASIFTLSRPNRFGSSTQYRAMLDPSCCLAADIYFTGSYDGA